MSVMSSHSYSAAQWVIHTASLVYDIMKHDRLKVWCLTQSRLPESEHLSIIATKTQPPVLAFTASDGSQIKSLEFKCWDHLLMA